MTSRTTARLVAGAAALGGLLCTAVPAHAALSAPVADAFVVSATGGLVTVSPTPHSNYPGPPSNTQTDVGINAGPFASSKTLTATTSGSPSAGTSSAEASAENLTVTLGPTASLVLGAVDTTCNATQSGANGNSSITNASFVVGGVTQTITVPNTNTTIPLPLSLGSLEFFPSSSDSNNVLTEDAIKITLGTGSSAQTLIIAQAQCGGAQPVVTNPTPMISAPMAAGAGATAVIGGVVYLRRRKSAKDTIASI